MSLVPFPFFFLCDGKPAKFRMHQSFSLFYQQHKNINMAAAFKNRHGFRPNFLPSFLIRGSAKLSKDFLQDKLPRNMIAPFTVR